MSPFAKPSTFQIKISKCGSDACNVDYDIMRHKNSIKLGLAVVKTMADHFSSKEDIPYFMYYLSCYTLANLNHNKTKEQVFEDIKNIEEHIKRAELAEVKK